MDFSEAGMFKAYQELTAQRDAKLAEVSSLQEALDKANVEAQQAREKGEKIAQAISKAKGGVEWLVLKKNIASLARALSKQNGVLASK